MHPRDFVLKSTQAFTRLVVVILCTRIVFSFFDFDKTNDFVSWIFSMSQPLLEPFRAIFGQPVYPNKFVLEFVVLFALVAYSLFGYFIYVILEFLPKPKVKKFSIRAFTKR